MLGERKKLSTQLEGVNGVLLTANTKIADLSLENKNLSEHSTATSAELGEMRSSYDILRSELNDVVGGKDS